MEGRCLSGRTGNARRPIDYQPRPSKGGQVGRMRTRVSGHILRLMPTKDRLFVLGGPNPYAGWKDPIPTNLFVVEWDGESGSKPEHGPNNILTNACVTAHATSPSGKLLLGVNLGGWRSPVTTVLVREPEGHWWQTTPCELDASTMIETMAVNDSGEIVIVASAEHGTHHKELLLRFHGTGWRAVVGAPDGGIHAVAINESGDLFVGGELRGKLFAAHRGVWRFSGSQWQPLGSRSIVAKSSAMSRRGATRCNCCRAGTSCLRRELFNGSANCR